MKLYSVAPFRSFLRATIARREAESAIDRFSERRRRHRQRIDDSLEAVKNGLGAISVSGLLPPRIQAAIVRIGELYEHEEALRVETIVAARRDGVSEDEIATWLR